MASLRNASILPRAPTRVLPQRACKSTRFQGQVVEVCHFLRLPRGKKHCSEYDQDNRFKFTEIRCIIYRHLIIPPPFWMLNQIYIDGVWNNKLNDKIYLAILRANRQIFSEASSLLYSETVLSLHANDIICLQPGTENIAVPKQCIWKHNPLRGIGRPDISGERLYDTSEIGGFMEPHVFSRFKHIELNLFLYFGDNSYFEPLQVDSHLKIIPEDRVKFRDILRQTNIITNFKEIISHSPILASLEIKLLIDTPFAFNENFLDANGDATDAYCDAIDRGAAEVFIESGVLDPLRSLSNVENALIDVLRTDEILDKLKLGPEFEDMLLDIEFEITCGNDFASGTEESRLHGGNDSDIE